MPYDVSKVANNTRTHISEQPTSEAALTIVQTEVDSYQLDGYVVRRLQAVLDGPGGEVVTIEGDLI